MRAITDLVDRVMVPLHERGFTPWIDSPITGWQAMLTTTGTGGAGPRASSVHYVVVDGAAYALAVSGPGTPWLSDLRADPAARLARPARAPITILATEETDPVLRARVIPRLLRSTGVAGLLVGTVPQRATDDELVSRMGAVPLVRLAPADGSELLPGPDDPGGHAWIWRQGLLLGLGLFALRLVRRARRWV